jgi:hypothetical protein
MLRIKFGHVAMIFGVLGIALLYVVTVLSQPVMVSNFSTLDEFEGEVVSVEGTVLSHRSVSVTETSITLYNSQQTLEVVTEFDTQDDHDNTRVNTILRATGEVQKKFNGEYQLVVLDPTNLVSVGIYEPPLMSLDEPGNDNNSYVTVTGTVTHIEDYYGDKQKITLRNGSGALDAILPSPVTSLKIGNNIEASGILRSTDKYRLYIYTSEVIRVMGQWHIPTVGLEDLMGEPERCTDFPTYLQGVVRYEPYSDPAYSFLLSNSALDSSISIKVDLSGLQRTVTLHKGDIVSMLTYSAYDPATLRYILIPVELHVLSSGETWQVTMDELAENSIEYERASLNLTGYLYMDNNSLFMGNRAIMDNCSYLLKIAVDEKGHARSDVSQLLEIIDVSLDETGSQDRPTNGIKTNLHGKLLFRQEHFDHVFTLKAEPASSF